MTRKEIEKANKEIGGWDLDYTPTEDEKRTSQELMCRELINSILIYHYKPKQTKVWDVDKGCYVPIENVIADHKYIKCYEDKVGGKERILELVKEQVKDFAKAKVGYAGTLEGIDYRYCKWADEQ